MFILLCSVLSGTFDVYVSVAGGEPNLVCVNKLTINPQNSSLLPKWRVICSQYTNFWDSFGDS